MKGGFSFCGVDIANIGLEYAPELNQTYIYAPTDTNVHEESFDGHDGGYVYGATKQPKEFTLRCFFEEKHIAKGVLAKAYDLFRVGRSGRLIFKRRPWCYYYATVTKADGSGITNYMNGIFVITMKAYYPFARGISITDKEEDNERIFSYYKTDPEFDQAMNNTALLEKDIAPETKFYNINPNGQDIILYNPGTERAQVSIVLSGTTHEASGIIITNNTTKQSCRYHAFNDDGDTTSYVDSIQTDGISGKTVIEKNGAKAISFLYHDYGFLELEPAFPILRHIMASSQGSIVTVINKLYEDEEEIDWYTGKYIYLFNDWFKIQKCTDKHTLLLDEGKSIYCGPCDTSIVSMNELFIKPETGTTITQLAFIYKPTYA